MHGGQRLSVHIQRAAQEDAGQEVARFIYTHSHTDWKQLVQLVRISTARWILILESGVDVMSRTGLTSLKTDVHSLSHGRSATVFLSRLSSGLPSAICSVATRARC